jgi:hypothetical protein
MVVRKLFLFLMLEGVAHVGAFGGVGVLLELVAIVVGTRSRRWLMV